MHLRALLLLVPLCLASCSAEPPVAPGTPSGEALKSALQGAWCVSDDEGKTCWGYDRFDGSTVQACGRLPEDGKPFLASASFVVEGHQSCYTVTTTNQQQFYPVGKNFCAKVLEINEHFQRYLFEGKVYKTYRIPKGSLACPSAA